MTTKEGAMAESPRELMGDIKSTGKQAVETGKAFTAMPSQRRNRN